MLELGEKVKKARKAAGLTQMELARKINMSQSYIADIERRRQNPSLSALQLIANALHVDIAEFVGDGTTVQETGLDRDEIDLVMAYRCLSEDNKAFTKTMVYKLMPFKTRYSMSTLSPRTRTSKMAMGG